MYLIARTPLAGKTTNSKVVDHLSNSSKNDFTDVDKLGHGTGHVEVVKPNIEQAKAISPASLALATPIKSSLAPSSTSAASVFVNADSGTDFLSKCYHVVVINVDIVVKQAGQDEFPQSMPPPLGVSVTTTEDDDSRSSSDVNEESGFFYEEIKDTQTPTSATAPASYLSLNPTNNSCNAEYTPLSSVTRNKLTHTSNTTTTTNNNNDAISSNKRLKLITGQAIDVQAHPAVGPYGLYYESEPGPADFDGGSESDDYKNAIVWYLRVTKRMSFALVAEEYSKKCLPARQKSVSSESVRRRYHRIYERLDRKAREEMAKVEEKAK